MQIKTEFVMIETMRAFIASPDAEAKFPGILIYSDIFQLSTSLLSFCKRLASYGFVVAAPEIFHRHEAAGVVLEQNDEGRARGARNALATTIEEFDLDAQAVIEFLQNHSAVEPENIGAGGFCIGGHLAYRAALNPNVKGAACFYPTWLSNGKLGQGENAGSLERASEIQGELLIIFGLQDQYIPEEARNQIINTLNQAKVKTSVELFNADHGFHPHLYPLFRSDFVLVLNEMVLVLVLDCPSDRVRVRVLPFGRSTSTKTPGKLECDVQRCG